ncbi:MAG TPA: hypothetical protein VD866_06885 [Urbifossiella sp.]|nr:hypothetical protein [Urbifossiella sp.]
MAAVSVVAPDPRRWIDVRASPPPMADGPALRDVRCAGAGEVLLAEVGPSTWPKVAGRVAHSWATVHQVEVVLAHERPGSPGHQVVEEVVGRADRRLRATLGGWRRCGGSKAGRRS